MSKIAELGDKKATDLKERFKNLGSILATYNDALLSLEGDISIKGKSLENANRENPSLYAFYDQRRVELKSLTDYMEREVERVKGRLFRSFTENSNRELSDRAKAEYVKGEQAYLDIHEIYLEVNEVYGQFSAAVEAFKMRGYALNNITKIRVANMENVIL